MKLLVQPGDNAVPLIKGIEGARRSVQIAIFRLDSGAIERALKNAVERGVAVQALIASTNRGGRRKLRSLEARLLDFGVSVIHTGDGLTRFHDKLMIIDRRMLFILAFNLTHRDIERSRSFGIVTSRRDLVQEALGLYEADAKRQPYSVKTANLIVSPLNARKRLTDFVRKAKKQLLIYDPKVSDPAIIRILEARVKEGVEVKIIGRITNNHLGLEVRKLSRLRLHTRTIIRDGRAAFIGSQSLRKAELDARRELGVIFFDRKAVNRLIHIFQEDWGAAERSGTDEQQISTAAEHTALLVSQTVADGLPPVSQAVKDALKNIPGVRVNGSLDREKVEATVKGAVAKAVADAVEEVVEEIVEEPSSARH